jgi:hypothetical protein
MVSASVLMKIIRERERVGIAAPTHIADKYSEDAITAYFQVIVRDATSQ